MIEDDEDEDIDISAIYVLNKKNRDPRSEEINEPLEVALERAVREALLIHKRAGVPAVIERDGKIVYYNPKISRSLNDKLSTPAKQFRSRECCIDSDHNGIFL